MNVLPFDPKVSHPLPTDDLEELAAVWALDAMPPGERAAYREHLVECSTCQALAGDFGGSADLIPLATQRVQPSANLKSRILALVASTRPAMVAPRPRPFAGFWQKRPWAAPALGLLAVTFLALTGILQAELRQRNSQVSEQEALLASISAGASVMNLSATGVAPGASGALVQPQAGNIAYLIVKDLGRLPSGQEYQVWAISSTGPTSAGTFAPSGKPQQILTLEADFRGADKVGVSIEPRGGSPAPSGPIVLFGPG
ncbi:MAG: hypothetical protein HW397_31 [Dehalococcoidia bacterium]|nr:hypothetical protein [Dehalococcoidia bacterium]